MSIPSRAVAAAVTTAVLSLSLFATPHAPARALSLVPFAADRAAARTVDLAPFAAERSPVRASSPIAGSAVRSVDHTKSPRQGLPYPTTRTVPVTDTYWGTSVSDPYRWLEDETSEEVKTWMSAEDGLARRELDKLPMRSLLRSRYESLLRVDSLGRPVPVGELIFYTRRPAGKDKSILYVRNRDGSGEKVVIDPNDAAFGAANALGSWTPSPDGSKLAYVIHPNNADAGVMDVLDVASGRVAPEDHLEGADYTDAQWLPDSSGFYYQYFPHDPAIQEDERQGHIDIRFHRLGERQSQDTVVHPPTGDPNLWLSPEISDDGRWLFAYIYYGWSGVEIRYRDLSQPASAFLTLFKLEQASASVIAWKDQFYVWTNDGAPNGQLFKVAADKTARADWKAIVPERPSDVLETFAVIGGRLVLQYLHNASHAVEIVTLDGVKVRDVALPTLGSVGGISGTPGRQTMYFDFSSFTYPRTIYQTSSVLPDISVWGTVDVPVDPAAYDVQQVWYPSRDGTQVSMFIVGKKGVAKDGSRPVLLYGYGGFAVNLLPEFSSSLFPWLEAGGLYAVPNLRGGAEYGEAWHQAGMLAKKQNVFDDFIAAAEYLIKEGYTQPERLAIAGASNGGLLVAAALTQRPELFKAVSCGVPLTDMLRYQRFGLGASWVLEYGSVEDEVQFKALYAYSPYHHVQSGTAYPAVLFLSADHDDRVDPLHARKMAAALQAAAPDGNPILLRIQRNAGHGGAATIAAYIDELVDEYAFLMDQVGLMPPPKSRVVYLPMAAMRWPPVPEKPVLVVSHTDDGDNAFDLEWSRPAGAASFQLQEATSESFADAKDVFIGAVTAFSRIDAPPGRHFYRVRGANEWGPGDWSATVMAEVPSLFLGLALHWDEVDQVRGLQVVDIGTHIDRTVTQIVDYGVVRVKTRIAYDPNPNRSNPEESSADFDQAKLTGLGSTAGRYAFGKGGAPWILPREFTPQAGRAVWLNEKAFNVTGPVYYDGLAGHLIAAWKLVNANDIIAYQDGANEAMLPAGGEVLWYAADASRLLVYYEEHLVFFYRGNRVNLFETHTGRLTRANAFGAAGASVGAELQLLPTFDPFLRR